MENACLHETVGRHPFSKNIETDAITWVYICKACRKNLGHEPCGQFVKFERLMSGETVIGYDHSRRTVGYESDFGPVTMSNDPHKIRPEPD